MQLTRKTFTTEDKSGCQFKCEAYYTRDYDLESNTFKTEATYYGVGLKDTNLNTLKERISEL